MNRVKYIQEKNQQEKNNTAKEALGQTKKQQNAHMQQKTEYD